MKLGMLSKLFPCKHPLDKLSPKGVVGTEPVGTTHLRHTLTFVCDQCECELTRSWDSMTSDMWMKVKSHTRYIEDTIFFGRGK